ncbi:hypothetical protein HDC90_000211 [Pedobacter sp. AK013]|nr:hypothetical protein [Pedobacter sp. AK013]
MNDCDNSVLSALARNPTNQAGDKNNFSIWKEAFQNGMILFMLTAMVFVFLNFYTDNQ